MRPALSVATAAGLLAALALPGPLPAAAAPQDGEPVPEGATLSVSTEKEEYLLGERVVLLWRLGNEGPRPFSVTDNTYQRFAVRDELLSVAMEDADGRAAWDPYPERMGGGGPVAPPMVLRKGESWDEHVDLWRYRVPDRAGTWKVRVSRHFGWRRTPERPDSSAETVLRFREPTEADARKVLDGLAAAGERASFGSAAYPIYIPLLEERASAGLVAAVGGLDLDRDLAATRALLRLFASKDRAVAERAGWALFQRIRVPRGEGDGGGQGYRWTPGGFVHGEQDMVPSWRPEFAEAARAAARAFLAGDGLPLVGPAGDILGLLGMPEDGPAVAAALDRISRAFEKTPGQSPGKEEERLDDLGRDERGLHFATRALVRRGLAVAAAPERAGEALPWLEAVFHQEEKDRPPAWWITLERLASHPLALVRREVATFCRLGDPSRPALCRLLALRLQDDPDERVREAAGKDC